MIINWLHENKLYTPLLNWNESKTLFMNLILQSMAMHEINWFNRSLKYLLLNRLICPSHKCLIELRTWKVLECWNGPSVKTLKVNYKERSKVKSKNIEYWKQFGNGVKQIFGQNSRAGLLFIAVLGIYNFGKKKVLIYVNIPTKVDKPNELIQQ